MSRDTGGRDGAGRDRGGRAQDKVVEGERFVVIEGGVKGFMLVDGFSPTL